MHDHFDSQTEHHIASKAADVRNIQEDLLSHQGVWQSIEERKLERSFSHRLISSNGIQESTRSRTWEGLAVDNPEFNLTESDFEAEGCNMAPHLDVDNQVQSNDEHDLMLLEADLNKTNNNVNVEPKIPNGKMHCSCVNGDTKRRLSSKPPTDLSKNTKRSTKSKIFSSVRNFVTFLSLLQLVQVMGSGYGKSALTSIERRYRLSTFYVGLLQSCFHIGNLSVILFVSYYGSKWNRPRAIAIGSLIMAISSFLSAMPQFIGSRYMDDQIGGPKQLLNANPYMAKTELNTSEFHLVTPNTNFGSHDLKPQRPAYLKLISKEKLCTPRKEAKKQKMLGQNFESQGDYQNVEDSKAGGDDKNENAEGSTEPYSKEYWNESLLCFFIACGSVLKGVGHSPLHPLGMSFVDDHATPRNSAVYIGVVSSLSLLGPAFGFILGSFTTRLWVDWGWTDVSKVTIEHSNPLWVGAWWMGYLITAFFLLIATIPLCFFPRELEKEQDDEPNNEDKFLGCIRRCCTERRFHVDEDNQQEKDRLNYDSDDDSLQEVVTTDKIYKPIVRERDEDRNHKNADSTIINYEIPHRNDDGAVLHIYDEFPDDLPSFKGELISYVENSRNGSIEVRSEPASNPCMTLSFSDTRLQNGNQNRQPFTPKENIIRKSLSEPGEKNRPAFNKRKKSDANRMSTSRRPSRLEKLALFDFTASLKGLLTDPVFMSITFAFVCLTSFLAASVTYVAKYMETQFSITTSLANLLNGSVNLPMAVVGNLLGGWLIRRFDLNVRKTMFVVTTGILLTIFCVTALLFLRCYQGTNHVYSIGTAGGECASNCNCEDDYGPPVCDLATNITYKSACHAGCQGTAWDGKTEIFTDCKCLLPPDGDKETKPVSSISSRRSTTVPGPCYYTPDCSRFHLYVFLGVMGAASLTAGLASTPSSLLVLRIVPPAEKAFAIGILFVFTRVLAWIPAPVYVGYIIDSSCLRWSSLGEPNDRGADDMEDEKNHCEMYDKDRLRTKFFLATGGLLVLSLFFYLMAVYQHSKRPRRFGVTTSDRRRASSIISRTVRTLPKPEVKFGPSSRNSENYHSESPCGQFYGSSESRCFKDKNFNDCVTNGSKKRAVSSALQKPFKIAISVSAPVLAHQTEDDGRFYMAPPVYPEDVDDVMHATAV